MADPRAPNCAIPYSTQVMPAYRPKHRSPRQCRLLPLVCCVLAANLLHAQQSEPAASPGDQPSVAPEPTGRVVPLDERAPFAPPRPAYAQRLVFDEATGGWIEEPLPLPGSEDGDLELARRAIYLGQTAAGRDQLTQWRKDHPASVRQDQAVFYLAESYLLEKRYWQAHKTYKEFLQNYAGSDLYESALRRELLIASSFLAGKPRLFLWVFPLPAFTEGLEILAEIEGYAKGTVIGEQAVKLAADYHYAAGDFPLAEEAYARLADDYPRGRYHAQSLLLAARSAQASFSGTRFDLQPILNAQARYRRLAQQYPDFALTSGIGADLEQLANARAEKRLLTATYYQSTGAREAAAFAYRVVTLRHPQSTAATQAENQLIAMGLSPEQPSPPAPQPSGPIRLRPPAGTAQTPATQPQSEATNP